MAAAGRDLSTDELISEGARLGPWAYEIDVRDGVTTSDFNARSEHDLGELGGVGFSSPGERFKALLLRLFPDGLEGRSVLECACNSGAFLFWAKELGAGRCFGIDIREHWIEQARFLAKHRSARSDDVTFAVHDLYDLPSLGLEQFDVTFFHGIFYHLPAPVSGLKAAADLTREAIIVSTTTQAGYDDGLLIVNQESTKMLRSGVYGLAWFPSGPEVLRRSLAWMGFPEVRVDRWRRRRGQRRARRDELRLVAARDPDALRPYDEQLRARAAADATFAVVRDVPEGAVVLVASGGDEALLELGPRRAWHFGQNEGGAWRLPRDDDAAIASLDRLGREGAGYLLIPAGTDLLARFPRFAAHLEERCKKAAERDGCLLYELPAADAERA